MALKDLTGKLTFAVPDTHPQAGTKIEKEFDYQQVETLEEAQQMIETKEWDLVDMVNTKLAQSARSNAYQNLVALYKPSEVSPDEIKARMVRDFIRLGLSEDVAKTQVESILAANNG